MGKPKKDKCDENPLGTAGGPSGRPLTTVHIDVMPLIVNATEAVCRIQPQGVSDESFVDHGLIRLPPGPPVELHFHLQDGENGEYADLAFADHPWSCRANRCPDPGDGEPEFPLATKVDDKLAKIRATPAPRNAWHYSLNFEGGICCDPIIIRE